MTELDGFEDENDLDGSPYLDFWYDPITDHVIFQLRQTDMNEPNEMECDMCGKQNNPRLREGGSYMCSTCWAIWNS